MRAFGFLFAYFSPETLLPMTSIVATIAGVVMIVGRGSLRILWRLVERRQRRPAGVAGTSKPHLHIHEEMRAKASQDTRL